MKPVALICFAACLLLARDGNGIPPRASSADYPARQTAHGLAVAAAIQPPEQVRKLFKTDISKGFIVVELAIYPEPGKDVEVLTRDFVLSIGSDSMTMARAVTPGTVAEMVYPDKVSQPQVPGKVQVYNTETIGYGSGGYDPATGRQRPGGVYTGSSVGVGVGGAGAPDGSRAPDPPRQTSKDRDRTTLEQQVADKALPEGKTTQAVAGYLYFPKPSGKSKNGSFDVTYSGAESPIRMSLPPK